MRRPPLAILLLFPTFIGTLQSFVLEKVNFKGKYTDVQPYAAIVGGSIHLPCNVTPPTNDDSVVLILWYRDDSANPVYSIDARVTSLLKAKHFPADIFMSRAAFNISYPVSYLELNPVKEDDGGEYRCRVDFKKARTVNRILKLNVIGNPSPSLIWYQGQGSIDDSYFISPRGTTINVLTVGPLTRDDLMMVLSCKGSNNNFTAPISKTIAIDINLKPREVKIITPMNQLSAKIPVEFVCQSTGSKPPAKIFWYIGDNLLTALGSSVSDDGSVTTSFLSFVPSIEDHGKRLSCVAVNAKYEKEHNEDGFVLQVKYPPQVSVVMGASAQFEQIIEGSDVIFECNVQANPPAHQIGWKLNGEQIGSNISENMKINNTTLLLRGITNENTGTYGCWARNEEGNGESDWIHLNIQYAPRCLSVERVIGLSEHESADIECEVDAKPAEISFHWSFNNTLNETLDFVTFTTNGLKSMAVYTPRGPLDFGLLYCWASNRVGTQKDPCLYYIVPAGPPDSPENCSVNNVTIHSLTVECKPGYSGGLDQVFHLEIYTRKTRLLLSNQTSSEYPFFKTHSLPAGHSFLLIVYSSNVKGKSPPVTIMGSTLLASQLFSGDEDDIVVSPILATLMSFVFLLVVLAVVTILVMKIKSEEETAKKRKRKRCKSEDEDSFHRNYHKSSPTSMDSQICMGRSKVVLTEIRPETEFLGYPESDTGVINESVIDAEIVPSPHQFYDICISTGCMGSPSLSKTFTRLQSKSIPILEENTGFDKVSTNEEIPAPEAYCCDNQNYRNTQSYTNS